MSDDILKRAAALVEKQKAWDAWEYPSKPAPPAMVEGEVATLVSAMAAEIARLRAACDNYFRTISLSQMRHGRILVGLERRNARQRRALAKLCLRRHDKNAALATARREGEAAGIEWAAGMIRSFMKIADKMSDGLGLERTPVEAIEFAIARTLEEAAAIRAAAPDGRPSEEIIREDRDAWPDHQANHPICDATKKEEQK